MTHPANKIQNQKRRTERARQLTVNNMAVTCPASRHVHMITDSLLSIGANLEGYYDAEHMAGSMLSVLESLWKQRAENLRLKEKLLLANGMKYVVCLDDGLWIADHDGDPPRTLIKWYAKRFKTRLQAGRALREARKYRPFRRAEIHDITTDKIFDQ